MGNAEFVMYWLWYAFEVANLYSGRSNSTTIPNLSQSRLGELPMPIPPLKEQRKIASVLSLAQKAIQQQDRLIELTTELKKALMQKLFTEGLDGEPQKQTELGPMPERWKLVRLGELFETQLGKMLSQKAHGGNEPKPYLRNKNVQWGYVHLSDMATMDFSDREMEKFRLLPGDLLVCEGGFVGRAALWRGDIEDCYYQKALHRLRPRGQKMSNEFLCYWLSFGFQQRNLYGIAGASSTIAHLPEVQLKALPIPLPQSTEQDEICSVLRAVDQSHETHKSRKSILSDLFRTLLHQFMTAQIRVNDLDVSELEGFMKE
jgi:type I restriction enzyme S subunit